MNMQDKISRREFFKRAGAATVAVGGLTACAGNNKVAGSAEEGEMTYRTTPKGDKVSILGFGMMRLPFKNDNIPGQLGEVDQDMVNEMVDYAYRHGVNYYDTSPAYCRGLSETATGIALSRYPRESYYLATKLSNFAPSTWSREASIAMYHNSFKALQTDYIDYLLLHAVGLEKGMQTLEDRYINNGVLDFLLKEREAGRIRNLGFSFHGDVKVFDWLLEHNDKYHWDFVQIQFNYMDAPDGADYLYKELEKRGIPAVIMEPLLGGRLSGVPANIAREMQEREPERSVASWAFRYAGSFPGVQTVLSGMTRMEHLKDNLSSFSPLKTLTDEDFAFLGDIAEKMKKYPTVPCNDCKYCMPCPYGLDIPAILLHYNKCVNEGNIEEDITDPEYRRARRAFLVGYDRSVPKLRQASHCISCGKCVSHCPQGIKIPRELRRINDYVEHLKQHR